MHRYWILLVLGILFLGETFKMQQICVVLLQNHEKEQLNFVSLNIEELYEHPK